MSLPKFGVKQARSLKVGDSVIVRPGNGRNPAGSIHTTALRNGITVTAESCYLVVPADDELFKVYRVTRVS